MCVADDLCAFSFVCVHRAQFFLVHPTNSISSQIPTIQPTKKKKKEKTFREHSHQNSKLSLSGTLAGVKWTAQIMKRKRQRVSTFPGKWCKISGIHIYIFSRRLQFGKLKRERNLLESIRHIICIAFIYGRTRTTFLFRWFAYSELYALLAYLEQLFFSVLFAKGNRYTHANQQHWAVAGAHFQR